MSESSSPELSVVCKNCGSEVSPYVTECPYCGTRLRRRAPKLERVGDEVRVQETRRDRNRRKAAERRARRSSRVGGISFDQSIAVPRVAIAAVAIPALLLVVQRIAGLSPIEVGALVDVLGNADPWRFLTAPFVYDDPGYLFACGLGIVIFLGGVERRIGILPAALLVLAAGSLGMLGAAGIERLLGTEFVFAAGGNGVALGALGAWWAMRDAERRADPDEEYWPVAVVVSAAVLLALPAVVDIANVWAGLIGGLVGLTLGLAAVAGRRR